MTIYAYSLFSISKGSADIEKFLEAEPGIKAIYIAFLDEYVKDIEKAKNRG